ncbi:uncharacterized protein E0L32_007995 [Thyridium curvatum]|uniref:Major facilitator superfamily (MFS) profile domain-containing protein n=1 Tax=Thyridium curvatum TaxID=1093900 RepID=A0A507AXE8_9PEZI|nr:uncharacterized protein E0L32_007995 [Thyridium curvatum]TPX11134.1 hypothetical protein E0L32_007995 [Thyridium curvatum]
MVRTNVVSTKAGTMAAPPATTAAVPTDGLTRNRQARMLRPSRPRIPSSAGSFHAGAPIPDLGSYLRSASYRRRLTPGLRRQSTHKYHTFPTPPPKPPSDSSSGGRANRSSESLQRRKAQDDKADERDATPLPVKQLVLLAWLSLCEQTALNSISPYLPTMVRSFEEIPATQTGLYVGLLASAFALAQLTTNLLWGFLSDLFGRKPTMILGTGLLMVCFGFFGFCTTYWQVLVVHIAMGLLNGNAAVVPTCLGEVTDRSNQSKAFTWLPVMYSIGGITGPALGGLLVREGAVRFPFLGPNIGSSALLATAVVILAIWLDETADDETMKAARSRLGWLERLFRRSQKGIQGRKGSWSARWPMHHHDVADEAEDSSSSSATGSNDSLSEGNPLLDQSGSEDDYSDDDDDHHWSVGEILNRTTIVVLLTYLIFQLSNISYNSLFPIFSSAKPPTGRGLGPGTIGLLLSFSGLLTIVFQILLFQPIKARLGNLGTFRWSLLGMTASMALIPWIGYLDSQPVFGLGSGKWWLYAETSIILLIKNMCAIGGLSSVMLLITNCASSHKTLATLNGVAQTLSAAGRSVGPFVSGALFTASTRIKPKGELLAWGLFAGITLVGWLGSLTIRGDGLESDDWVGDDEEDSDEDHEDGSDAEHGGPSREHDPER